MKNTMTLKVLSPENYLFNENDVVSVILPTITGKITILPNHTNFITQIYNGKILIKTVTSEKQITITGGYIKICDNNIHILIDVSINNKLLLIQRKKFFKLLFKL
jgi:F-type H+-transporting ATPase subunit epsilon